MTEESRLAPPLTARGLSVVLPAHNEELAIENCVRGCVATLSRIAPDYEIVVVDDGSVDATPEIADLLAASNPRIQAVHNHPQRGYGGALRAGFAAATKDLLFFMDADGQFDFREIEELLAHTGQGHPAVLGYRRKRRDPLIRLLNARAWNGLVSLVFDIHVRDVDCAFKLYDRALIQRIDVHSEGAMINTEILVKLSMLGVGFVQVPVNHYPRQHGEASGANAWVILRAFRELFRLRKALRSWARSAPLQPEPQVR